MMDVDETSPGESCESKADILKITGNCAVEVGKNAMIQDEKIEPKKEVSTDHPPEDDDPSRKSTNQSQPSLTSENTDNNSVSNENSLSSKTTMEVDTPVKQKEAVDEQPIGEVVDTPSQPSTSSPATAKTNEKKAGARTSSESPSIPNKLAKMSPRSTRSSQNPDFAAKQRKFLTRVNDTTRRDVSDSENSQDSMTPASKLVKDYKARSAERKTVNERKRKLEQDAAEGKSSDSEEDAPNKKKKTKEPTKVVGGIDSYCWRCHRDGKVIPCESCPRVYHLKCVQMDAPPPKGWMCPECSAVMHAENTDSRSRAMRMLSLDQLCNMLRFALNRMKNYEGSEDFLKPVDLTAFPNYRDFIVKPMDLSQLERNIKAKHYGSTEAFLADAKWIVHNSIIFNSVQSKFTNTARALMKICRQEMQEIENCPDCYQNAHTRSTDSWFIEACRRPHMLVWAKLKGFPYWPAKAMATNHDNMVDVRFFGAHDRAWVPVTLCFLYSKLSPAPPPSKNKRNLEECLQELECHIKKLRDKFGVFEYAPYKTPYNPKEEDAQLAMFLPKYEAKIPGKRVMRISLHQDGARKSLLLHKASAAPVEKTASNKTPAKQVTADDKPDSDKTSSQKTPAPPMVCFPAESKQSTRNSQSSPVKTTSKVTPQKQTAVESESQKQRASPEGTPGTQGTAPPGLKKSHKTAPLTAAAKKCFATKDKSCTKCHTQTSTIWHRAINGGLFCTECISQPQTPNKPEVQGKCCAKCHTSITMVWLTSAAGLTVCSSCGFADQLFEKDDRADDPNSTIRGTVTVQRKPDNSETVPESSVVVESDGVDPVKLPESDPEERSEAIDEGAGGEGVSFPTTALEVEPHTPSASGDTQEIEFAAVDSPPKFIIPKGSGSESPETSKKVSIVDKLQEKLCYAVEEALHLNTETESLTVEKSLEEPEIALENDAGELARIDVASKEKLLQVVLHDLKNNKKTKDAIKETEGKQSANKTNKEMESETRLSSETSSEPDTDASSSVESDSFATGEESNKKKKQNNINNVVRTLKERNGSVDGTSDQSNTSPTAKESSAILLDDTNDEVPVLVIDEGGYNSSDSKKSSGKSDKSRRKGIPAKVCSRSSTSTESSDISSPEDPLNRSQDVVEVLDEFSGQFRRSSTDSNVTITLVTDEGASQKKTPTKEIRTVNISKSLSLSVVNEPSASLEMECIASDLDDQAHVDSLKKNATLKPTARKTLPNPPNLIDIPKEKSKSLQKKASVLESIKARSTQALMDTSAPPPPLVNLRPPAKVYGPSKAHSSGLVVDLRPPPAKTPVTTARSDVGPVNAQIDEAVQKVSEKLRSVTEELLQELSQAGNPEARIKLLQAELERQQWRHRQELAEYKHNADLMIMENRSMMEGEKQKSLLNAKHKYEMEKEQAIQEVKKKQWCSYCQKEAQLYCCWNTSYCTYECQVAHWPPHMASCRNKQPENPERNGVGVPVRVNHPAPRAPFNVAPRQMHEPDAWVVSEEDLLDLEDHKGRKKRCGVCQGCRTQPCGQCYGCTNRKGHSVCKNRRCSVILTKASQVAAGAPPVREINDAPQQPSPPVPIHHQDKMPANPPPLRQHNNPPPSDTPDPSFMHHQQDQMPANPPPLRQHNNPPPSDTPGPSFMHHQQDQMPASPPTVSRSNYPPPSATPGPSFMRHQQDKVASSPAAGRQGEVEYPRPTATPGPSFVFHQPDMVASSPAAGRQGEVEYPRPTATPGPSFVFHQPDMMPPSPVVGWQGEAAHPRPTATPCPSSVFQPNTRARHPMMPPPPPPPYHPSFRPNMMYRTVSPRFAHGPRSLGDPYQQQLHSYPPISNQYPAVEVVRQEYRGVTTNNGLSHMSHSQVHTVTTTREVHTRQINFNPN